MVIQLVPPSDVDLAHARVTMADRAFLAAAILDPHGPERATLTNLIRSHGLAALGTHDLRHTARYLLGKHGTVLPEATRVLLTRLGIAGYEQPAYREYTAVAVLCRTDAATRRAAPETISRIALRTAADITGLLGELPQLADLPERERLLMKIATIRALCATLAFASAPEDGLEYDEPDADPVMLGAMLPESPLPAELIFQAVNQASECLDTAASLLTSRAIAHIAHDQATLAATDVHYANVVVQPLIGLLGLIDFMGVQTWLKIREYIERPSAIQSPGWHALHKDLLELERIAKHPRYPKHEQARLPWLQEALTALTTTFNRWKAMHRAIAAAHTPEGSPGLSWLEEQVAPVLELRRRGKTAPTALLEATGSAGGCPMGFGVAPATPAADAGPIGY